MKLVLSRYPDYRYSGVPWLGELPQHWEMRTLRQVLERKTERGRPDLPLLSVVREKGVIRRDVTDREENRNYIPEDLSNYKVVRTGQFAMNKMKAWQGSYGVSAFDGIVSPAYFVFDVNGVGGPYFHASIRSRAYVPFFAQASDGVRIAQWDLSEARMREIPYFVPPFGEQEAIVIFLDYVDRRVNRFIRAKRRLIALLNEQKQAIIHRAVTRGLDPNVRLKPSGVDWLGDIPEHWEVRRLRQLAHKVTKGTTPTTLGREFVDEGIRFVKVESISDSLTILHAKCAFIDDVTHQLLSRSSLAHGDVLIAIAGAIGRVAVVEGSDSPANTNQAVAVVRPRQELITCQWLAHYLSSPHCQRHLVDSAVQSAQANLSLTSLGRVAIVLPPLIEQEAVIRTLTSKTAEIRVAIDRAQEEIGLIREYRIRLVADVVTGKLDVREAAASLPGEAGPEMLDADEDQEGEGAKDADEIEEFASAPD